MGNYCSSNLTPDEISAKRVDAEITRRNLQDHRQDQKILKLLLLGTGESGKSTIFKQVRQLYGEKWSNKDLAEWVARVYENVNLQIIAILKARKDLDIPLEDEQLAGKFSHKTYKPETPITPEVAENLKLLWNDKGFQEVWERRADYQVLECIEYYMQPDVLDRIASETKDKKYIPTFDDVLQARVRTTGITQERFKLYGANFVMFDVGGQRSERKKWLNCFDNVMTVIYVAAINEYDQKLFEDSRRDRVKEAIVVWKDIVNRDTFQDIGFVLFLNKMDLFKKKVLEFPFSLPGPDGRNHNYKGEDPMEVAKQYPGDEEALETAIGECANYMRNLFLDAIAPRTGYGAISSHFTTATDTKNMDLVFQNCQDQILRTNLVTNGFGLN